MLTNEAQIGWRATSAEGWILLGKETNLCSRAVVVFYRFFTTCYFCQSPSNYRTIAANDNNYNTNNDDGDHKDNVSASSELSNLL